MANLSSITLPNGDTYNFKTYTNNIEYKKSSASGSIVHFEDGAEADAVSVIAHIEPVQDLYGYDSPWPAGGGVNKFDFAASFDEGETVTQNGVTAKYSNGYLKITGTNTSETGFNIIYKQLTGTLPAGTYIMPNYVTVRAAIDGGNNTNYASAMTANSGINLVAFYVAINASATDLNWNIPMIFVEGTTRPTTYSPYSNICPITGHTEANVVRTGKNLISIKADNSVNLQFITITGDEGNLTFKSNGNYGRAGYVATGLKVGEQYTFSAKIAKTESSNVHTAVYLNNEASWASRYYGAFSIGTPVKAEQLYSITFVATTDTFFVGFYVSAGNSNPDTITVKEAKLEVGSSVTPYEPYIAPTIYPITFPSEAGTVYGGYVDVTNGKLVVNAELEVFDQWDGTEIRSQMNYFNSDRNVSTIGDYTRVEFGVRSVDQSKYNRISSSYAFKMCNIANHVFSYNAESTHWYRNTVLYLFLPTSLVGNTSQSVLNYLSSIKDTTPLSLWIPYTTPITYDLTPQQIALLKGANNVWNDANGEMEVEYIPYWMQKLVYDVLSPLSSFHTTVGDGTTTSFTINHYLNTKNILVSVNITDNNITYIAPLTSLASLNQIGYAVIINSNDSIVISFTSAPASNAAEISIISAIAYSSASDENLLRIS